jgi:hypothetical protein
MGWDSCYDWTKKQHVINSLVRSFVKSEWKIHAQKSTADGAWFVVENTSGCKFIYFALIKKHSGVFSVKTMTEHMGPSYYSCPVSFLDIADSPAPSEVHAIEWRKKLVEVNESAKVRNKRTLSPGMEIKLYGKDYTVVAPHKNTFTVRCENGNIYKLTRSQMKEWEYATKLGELLEA